MLQSSNQGISNLQPVLQSSNQGSQSMIQLSNQRSASVSWISELELQNLKEHSCSRKNFAKNLACMLFDEDTRINSNVSGRGKRKLNPIIVSYIQSVCFQFYPHDGDEEAEWKICIKAIDEGNRRLNRKKI